MNANSKDDMLGALLAGGLSRRMGTPDKFLLSLDGKSLLQHTIERTRTQVGQLVIVANGDLTRLANFGLPVIDDGKAGPGGPLAGVISAMTWAQDHAPDLRWLATVPTDTPGFPCDCWRQLRRRAETRHWQVVCVAIGEQAHYTFAVWSMALLPQLQGLYREGTRALHTAMSRCAHGLLRYKPEDGAKGFFNVNTQEDWQVLLRSTLPPLDWRPAPED